jgi:antitoxin component of RelBE/YafQ-DinJ toxin-antitoxin module
MDKRKAWLQVRVNETEKQRWRDAAERVELSMSEMVRRALEMYIGGVQ